MVWVEKPKRYLYSSAINYYLGQALLDVEVIDSLSDIMYLFMGRAGEMLDYSNFFRPHQSHLINLGHMKKYDKSDGGIIWISDSNNVPLSRHKKMAFGEIIKNL